MDKVLLNIAETAEYLNIGKTKTRELFKAYEHSFVVQIGNRHYAHKERLDAWLKTRIGKGEI